MNGLVSINGAEITLEKVTIHGLDQLSGLIEKTLQKISQYDGASIMQYILTQEEYYSLIDNKKTKLAIENQKLQELCITICNTMPIKKYDNTLSPWGCIFTNKNWYCDKCPVSEICPTENKNWSK